MRKSLFKNALGDVAYAALLLREMAFFRGAKDDKETLRASTPTALNWYLLLNHAQHYLSVEHKVAGTETTFPCAAPLPRPTLRPRRPETSPSCDFRLLGFAVQNASGFPDFLS
jgi:hypothetical protein